MTASNSNKTNLLFLDAIQIASDIVAGVVFLYWMIILVQSFRNHYKFGSDDTNKLHMYSMHFFLLVCNIIYIIYEIGVGTK